MADEKAVVAAVPTNLLIAGRWVDATGNRTFEVEDPATEEVLTRVADGTAEDGLAALEAAHRAQADWARTTPRVRAELLRAAYERLVKDTEELALLMTLEMGKPLAESRGEVTYAAEFFRWFSEQAVRIKGDYYVSPDGTTRVLTTRQPVGPAYMITPWNFPLAMLTRKVGPALAAGCTVVVKPAEQTPLCSLALGKIFQDLGLPPGVFNIVTTSDPGGMTEALVNDPRLRKLSFTGSTEVGRSLVRSSANNLLRISMELGGNAPLIVFEDADLEKAVQGAYFAKMRNNGEACTSANRILVHSSIAKEFSARLGEVFSSLRVGRGTEDGVQVGPLIDTDATDKVGTLLADATKRGATIVAGGVEREGRGHFFTPTVLTGVDRHSRVFSEEIFGPVAPVFEFSNDQEAIEMANDTSYGLVSYIFSESFSRVVKTIEALDTGMVGVNQGLVSNAAAPFGGVKHSGFGREGGYEGIEEYLTVKYAALNLG